jgi:hypothetical protein
VTTKEFLAKRHELVARIDAIEKEFHALNPEYPGKKNLRQATPLDIREGNVIWQLDCDDGEPHWQIIEWVRDPDDPFKAFEASDGCRYGLHDCWVEVEA